MVMYALLPFFFTVGGAFRPTARVHLHRRAAMPPMRLNAASGLAAVPAADAAAVSNDARGAWAPVASVAGLTGLGPQAVELFGRTYAVWEHDGAWSVLDDACPHRLAPLSQGRVDATTGCLECPYHGWQFDANGACTRVPQAERLPAARAASLPTRVTGDLLWAFFDEVATGEAGAAGEFPEEIYPWLVGAAERGVAFYVRELAYSFDVLVENFMDPAHIPFAHHGLQGARDDGSPIAMTVLAQNATHCEASFEDVIRGKARKGVVSFRRPARYHFRTLRENGEYETNLEIFVAPVRDGRCRVFFASPLGSKVVPTWLSHAASSRFLNTDIWLHDAERRLRSSTDGDAAYFTPSSSDLGANLWRKWWRSSGMAASPPHAYGPANPANLDRLDRRSQIDPWKSHAAHCAPCRKALGRTRYADALAGALVAAAVIAPVRRVPAAALLAAGCGLRYAAGRCRAIIQGEDEPSRVADRSVAADDNPPAPKA